MSLWTVCYKLLHIYIRYDTYLYEVMCRGMLTTKWSSSGSRCAFLLPRGCFVVEKPPLLHLEEICDVSLFTFSQPLDPIAPPCGHLQVLIPGPWRAAGHRGTLPRRRQCPPLALRRPASRPRRLPHRAAAVKRRHILAPELLPLHVGGLSRHVTLEIKVPTLVGHFHAHTEQPLEVVLQLLVVHRPEEIPPHRPHLQFQGLDASEARELWVRLYSWSCCCCWWRGHLHVPSASMSQK